MVERGAGSGESDAAEEETREAGESREVSRKSGDQEVREAGNGRDGTGEMRETW